jgi:hypothetical protein
VKVGKMESIGVVRGNPFVGAFGSEMFWVAALAALSTQELLRKMKSVTLIRNDGYFSRQFKSPQ